MRSSISTSAVAVKLLAVDAVPVTSPVIPPMKLEAATADAVRTPTIMSGEFTRFSAPVAIPVTLPVTLPVKGPLNDPAVIIPDILRLLGSLSFSRTGSLSLEIVPNPMFAPSNSVNSEPIPVNEYAVTIPVA